MTTQGLTCLLIEGNPADQKFFCAALAGVSRKVNCVNASDGFNALEKLKSEEHIPDYIFIDINMPGMNSNQFLLEIKKIDRLKAIPVFMYSSSANPDSISQTKENGAAGYIIKTDNMGELTETLVHLFKNRTNK